MRRKAEEYLHSWIMTSQRKPLLMRGARQVGKTWLVHHLANITKKQLIEINFERNPELYDAFTTNEPEIILRYIELKMRININIEESILFLDEVQVFPELIAKLRWFYELLPALPVVAAGSLLDFALAEHTFSMPVGRISYLHINPLSFEEFLNAKKNERLVSFFKTFQLQDEIPSVLHDDFMSLFREYLVVGGMPAAVNAWIGKNSLREVAIAHSELVLSYREDFAKYARKIPTRYLEETFSAIPHMLGQKFVYSHVNSDVKATVMKDALNLLCKARVCYKVNAIPANGLPLLAGVDHRRFKVEFIDVGLVSTLLELRLDQIQATKDVNLINQGALSEQVVAQLLRCTVPEYIEAHNYYWAREEKSSNAEVDYIISHHGDIIPVEVKSGTTGSLKSLHLFMQLKQRKLAVRINSDVPSFANVNVKSYDSKPVSYELLSIPFYLIEQLPRLLDSISGTRHVTK